MGAERPRFEQCKYGRAWDALVRAKHAVLDGFERELESRHGLSLAEYSVLLRLGEAPGKRMRMVDLAESASISKSGASRLVDRLADRGLVERVPCAEDRRSVWACLTPAGRRKVLAVRPKFDQVVRTSLASHLSEMEADQLARLLEKLAPDSH